jgi:predicted Ser/Thr protein kinase
MTDKRKIYISLLPLIVIIILILGAGYFLLADEIKLPKFNKGPQIRRIEGFPTTVFVEETAVADKQRRVIKSEQELNEYLNSVDKTGMLTMRDKINFDKEYVIAVSTEVVKEDEHKVKVRKVYEDKDSKTLLVSIVETFPGDTCNIELNPHIGIDLVAINKTDWTIDFERVKDVEECGNKTESTSSN